VTERERLAVLEEHARRIRLFSLQLAYECGMTTHLGGGLSHIEALTVLYGDVMEKEDKFILSKGHGVLGLYATLAEFGIVDKELLLKTFMKDGSDFMIHPVMKAEYGIEVSSGSLGQGISIAAGLALAAKKTGSTRQTYVICGNGEFNEGSVWEACMSAASFGLDNFTLFLDNNHLQSDGASVDVLDVSDYYACMLKSLHFQVLEIDGNDIAQVYKAFHSSPITGCPRAIIGNTIKGKGVSFMENNNEWHHNRLTKERYDAAVAELEGSK